MVEYPTDIEIAQNGNVLIDDTNDISTVDGRTQLEQSVGIDVLSVTDEFIGERLDGETLGLLEERIRQSIVSDEQFSDVQTVNIEEFNPQSNIVTAEIISEQNDNFTIGVPV